jgi:hypothetical protein
MKEKTHSVYVKKVLFLLAVLVKAAPLPRRIYLCGGGGPALQ